MFIRELKLMRGVLPPPTRKSGISTKLMKKLLLPRISAKIHLNLLKSWKEEICLQSLRIIRRTKTKLPTIFIPLNITQWDFSHLIKVTIIFLPFRQTSISLRNFRTNTKWKITRLNGINQGKTIKWEQIRSILMISIKIMLKIST